MTGTRIGGPAALACEGLVAGYRGRAETVLDGVTLALPTGCVTAILGPNGSGKSTLLRVLAGLHPARKGRVQVGGADVKAFSTRALARARSVLFQENRAPSGLTVERLVQHGRFPHLPFLGAPGADDGAAGERALERTGLGALRHERLERLSGGQKQLAWIAMALAQEASLLLLDEPTTFLDLRHQVEVLGVLERLVQEDGATVVCVLHGVDLAARYAQNVVLLRDGRVFAAGEPRDVVTAPNMAQVFGVDGVVVDVEGAPHFVPTGPR